MRSIATGIGRSPFGSTGPSYVGGSGAGTRIPAVSVLGYVPAMDKTWPAMQKLWTWAAAGTVVLAACGGGDTSGTGNDAHDGGHSGAGTAECSASGTSLAISSDNSEFDTDCLAVRAGEKFTVAYDNQENVAHNFAILPESGKGKPLFDTGVFNGPAKRNLEAGPLEAGSYPFHCVVHPNMVGTFVVQ